MSKEKKIIYVLTGILFGILLSVAFLGNRSSAASNVKKAASRLIERYQETKILPSVGLGIFIEESGGGHNNGRYYGNMSSRIYDIRDSTDQFLDLMDRYGNVNDQKTWYGQLVALQSHGYYGGSSSHYISEVSSIIQREGFTRYDEKAKERVRKIRKRKLQKGEFLLAYDPKLLPWQARTYRGVIRSGTVLIGYDWLDVVDTVPGRKPVIYIGDVEKIKMDPVVKLDAIIEEAVG